MQNNDQENIIIRPLIARDKEQIAGILERHHMFYPLEIDVALELVDDVLKKAEKSDYYFYCAEDENGRLAGYICFGPIPLTEHAYDLYWIAVDRETARTGVATRLLHVMEEHVVEMGGKYIYVDTSSSPSYDAARRFYQKHGYQVKCVLDHFYRPGDHKVLFVKEV